MEFRERRIFFRSVQYRLSFEANTNESTHLGISDTMQPETKQGLWKLMRFNRGIQKATAKIYAHRIISPVKIKTLPTFAPHHNSRKHNQDHPHTAHSCLRATFAL